MITIKINVWKPDIKSIDEEVLLPPKLSISRKALFSELIELLKK